MLAPLAAPVRVTIVRRARSGLDRNGNDTWAEATVNVDGCAWWPGTAGRNVAASRTYGAEDFRSSTATRAQVMFPVGTVIRPDDELVLSSLPTQRWRVDGEGLVWESQLTGASTGVQVNVERVDG